MENLSASVFKNGNVFRNGSCFEEASHIQSFHIDEVALIIDSPCWSSVLNYRRFIKTFLFWAPTLSKRLLIRRGLGLVSPPQPPPPPPPRGLSWPTPSFEKNAKLWTDVYPSRIAPFLMIQYAFWSSWPDLSFELKLVFFDVFRSSSSKSSSSSSSSINFSINSN